MSRLKANDIYPIIKPCGLAPKKSKAIIELSKILVEKYSGNVPKGPPSSRRTSGCWA